MNVFPDTLKPSNISQNKESLKREHLLGEVRTSIYTLLVKRDSEKEYFDLTELKRVEKSDEIIKTLISELVELGWKCDTSYGGTGLFIYSTEDRPENCYPDNFL